MSEPTDLSQQIEDAAAEPKRVESDMGEVEARPIQEIIAADKYLASKAAAEKPAKRLRFTKLSPPGADQ